MAGATEDLLLPLLRSLTALEFMARYLDPLVIDAVAGLIRFYQRNEAHDALASLLERRAKLDALPPTERVSMWTKLHELASGPLIDPAERTRKGLGEGCACPEVRGRRPRG